MFCHCKTNIKTLTKNSAKKCKPDCYNYMKNIDPVKIPRDKIKFFSNARKGFNWTQEAEIIEKHHKKVVHKNRIRTYDYSTSLPKPLYNRVAKIISLPPIEKDVFEPDAFDIEDHPPPAEQQEEETKEDDKISQKSYNESTCSLILKLQQKFNEIQLKTEEIIFTTEKKKNVNWFSDYVCEEKRKRVKWKTKLYKLDRDISTKPLDEQAEDMMEAVSERFANWINSYGTSDTDITKDYIRALFNIDSGSKLLFGVKIDPRVIKSVPHYVAKTWKMPHMSMTKKFEKKLLERKEKIPTKIITHAFGRTIPYRDRPWMPSDADKTIEPYCPEELLTRSKIFEGIAHLKSTKELLNYMQENPKVDRPPYLVEKGWFIQKETGNETEDESIPLYELFEKAQREK